MKDEAISIEVRAVAQLEEQLTYIEHEILQALHESAMDNQLQSSHEKGVFQ